MPIPDDSSHPIKAPARRGRPRSGGREAILVATLDLLVERGASRLTTREVATRAGVSEGSVFYHFTDRTGLLTAVIEDSLTSLMNVSPVEPEQIREMLNAKTGTIEQFMDKALIVLIAAQSDAELRDGMAKFLLTNNFGPHRGVDGIAVYLRSQQRAGRLRDDVDPVAIAMMLLGSIFMQVCMRRMVSNDYGDQMPGRAAVLSALVTMLTPPAPALTPPAPAPPAPEQNPD